MKSMSNKINKEAFKSKDEIENLLIDLENMDMEEKNGDLLPSIDTVFPEPTGSLVPDKYYTGGLFPLLSRYLPEELQLTSEEQKTVVKGFQKKFTGLSSSVPIKCYEKCPFKDSCPLAKIGKAPVGHNCPIEAAMLDLHTKRYLDEFKVEADNFSEVTTMTMLAATHVMEMRGWISIGKDDEGQSPDGIIKNVVGFSEDTEEPIVQYQEHPAYNIIERAWRWRTKLLESLGATRKDKLRWGKDDGENELLVKLSQSSIRSKIDTLTVMDITSED